MRSLVVVATLATGLSSLHAAGLGGLVDRSSGPLDVLLGGDAHHERGDVHHLLAHRDVALADQHAGLVDGGGELALHDEGLESALEELGGGETEDVIELPLVGLEHTESHHSSDERITYQSKRQSHLVSHVMSKVDDDVEHARLAGFVEEASLGNIQLN